MCFSLKLWTVILIIAKMVKSAGSENVKWLTVQCDQTDCLSHTINKCPFEPFCVWMTHILLGVWHCSYLGRKEQEED